MPARAEVITALPTPFDTAGELDLPAFAGLCAELAGVVDGAFVNGTTAEFPALERAERAELAGAALAAFGPERTVVHVGAAATRQSVTLTRDAVSAGARRIAVLTPYYLPADDTAVLAHFAAVVAAAGPAEVIGYLFPERTGVVVEPAVLARAVARTGLSGAKLSGSATDRFVEYRAALPAAARLWSGADTTLAAVVRAGGSGVVSGLSAAAPEPFAALAEAVAAGDPAAEADAQARVDAVLTALRGTPEGIKLALHHRRGWHPGCRMPHPGVPDAGAIAAAFAPVGAR